MKERGWGGVRSYIQTLTLSKTETAQIVKKRNAGRKKGIQFAGKNKTSRKREKLRSGKRHRKRGKGR